ncbi:MAG: hypothetical protein NT029_15855 [Armatimonadetes bacterium]|nr:hypothetical protein [Armatimonadota bacterium]
MQNKPGIMVRMNRDDLRMLPIASRKHKLEIDAIAVNRSAPMPRLEPAAAAQVAACADQIRAARAAGRPVMLTYGAHLIKNGLSPVVIALMEGGWLTHIATNGAGSIHDWEFALGGLSTEDVRANTATGCFGTWDETGRYINMAVAAGGLDDLGYGASVGRFISEDGVVIPSRRDLVAIASDAGSREKAERAAAAADLLTLSYTLGIDGGAQRVRHRRKEVSVQCAAWDLDIPFTVHPGIGYDIIYTHPANIGGAVGRGAVVDFLSFAQSVSELTGGVHLAVGSAVMAPMIFEKALSMANNRALAQGRPTVHQHALVVVDIQEGGDWDWSTGEPPMDHPAYYLRFCKTFYRMGGALSYVCLDNALFMTSLLRELEPLA